jgi:hypothetical protein
MAQIVLRAIFVAVLIVIGWSVGRAQERPPSFNFTIDTPVGDTTIQCESGCEFYSVWQGAARASSRFTFSCAAEGDRQRCSGRFGVGALGRPFGAN